MQINNRKWIERIDLIKKKNNIKSDSELSKKLKVSRQAINRIRTNKSRVGHLLRLRILLCLGYKCLSKAIKDAEKNDD